MPEFVSEGVTEDKKRQTVKYSSQWIIDRHGKRGFGDKEAICLSLHFSFTPQINAEVNSPPRF
jgi:hypothetical protein